MDKKYIEWLMEKYSIKSKGKRNRNKLYDINSFLEIFESAREIPYMQLIINILELYKNYKNYVISIPNGLKGDVGELLAMDRLKHIFPQKKFILLGGTYPGFDILFESKRIQIKTYFNTENYEKYGFNVEMCPDVKKNFEQDCDYVLLVQIYLKEDYTLDNDKTTIYVFNRNDFKYFSKKGCWGAKRGNKTIWNVTTPLSPEQENNLKNNLTIKKEAILYYNRDEYRKLFKESKENWKKLIEK